MEGWRQRRISSEEDHSTTKGKYKTELTRTGLLMEGVGFPDLGKDAAIVTQNDRFASDNEPFAGTVRQ
jgi:hypothetical protein